MKDKKEVIKRAAIIFLLVLVIIVVGFLMIRYETEGEKNLPFTLSKIMVISTADGELKGSDKIVVTQCNDLYLTIEKTKEDDSMIKNVYIENIKIMSQPQKGTVSFYRPNTTEGQAYVYKDELKIEDAITYVGNSKTSMQDLTISNQGGTIGFRTCLRDIGEITVDANAFVKNIGYLNDGTLLEKAKINISEIRYNLGFDVIIELADEKMYKGYVNISLPTQDVEKGGVKGVEKANINDVIFKRIKIK